MADKLKSAIQDALDSGRITGAVILDGSILVAHSRSGKVAPPPGPIVKPAVVATSGDLSLYADGSIGSAAVDAYNKGYSGPGQLVYGFYFNDARAVFPQISTDPVMSANVAYNYSNVYSPISPGDAAQGYSASLNPDGHGFDRKSVTAIRGTLALRASTTDIPALLDSWKAAGYYPVQVEQGASGKAFP
jgi:hypothetical protein